jgi:NitT/TauT family transport system substrate-binding protein
MQRTLILVVMIAVLLAGCGAGAPTAPVNSSAASTEQTITLAMPFIPNVQFAYYYVADKRGFYAAEGLKVNFDYNFETDVVQRVANGTVQFGMASGDSVLLARAQGLPVQTIATTSQRFPVVFFSKAEQNITTPADLKGKTIGIPGRFGASYIGLRALLYANGLSESDLQIQEIGFTQAAAVSEDKVQVAAGYGNNEPIQLASRGIAVNAIKVSDSFPLASDGIIAAETLIAQNPELVRKFVRATLKGMQATIANPDAAFTDALTYIPEAQRGDQALQRQVLAATIGFWQSDLTAAQGLGTTDAQSWQKSYTFLRESGILKQETDVKKAFTNQFLK